MNRRNFLAAALAAPWVVRSGVLMPVRKIVTPQWSIGADGKVAFLSVYIGRAIPGGLVSVPLLTVEMMKPERFRIIEG